MARNVVQSAVLQPTPVPLPSSNPAVVPSSVGVGVPPMRGGALGVLSSVGAAQRAPVAPFPSSPTVAQFRVVQGGWCQLDKCRVPIRAGKIVDETQYDLSELRRQGITLAPLEEASTEAAQDPQALLEEQRQRERAMSPVEDKKE